MRLHQQVHVHFEELVQEAVGKRGTGRTADDDVSDSSSRKAGAAPKKRKLVQEDALPVNKKPNSLTKNERRDSVANSVDYQATATGSPTKNAGKLQESVNQLIALGQTIRNQIRSENNAPTNELSKSDVNEEMKGINYSTRG